MCIRDSSITDPEAFVRTNVMGTTTLLDACRTYGIKRYHQVSTEDVYKRQTQEEDDDRTRIYHGTEMDGAIMYGKPGKKPPMWLHSIMYDEMEYFNNICLLYTSRCV